MRIEAGASAHEGRRPNSGQTKSASNDGDPRFKAALADLKHAAGQKHVEPICTAYQALRVAAKGMAVGDVIAAVNNSLGADGMAMIVSAYSHRECFMCSGGQAKCEQCKATGSLEQDRPCPNCDGKGLLLCGFCRGTGWADRETIPSELKTVVLERQLSHVRRQTAQLAHRLPEISPEKLEAMPPKQRNQILQWLMRLQARLSYMLDSGVVSDEDELSRMKETAEKVETYLEPLRS
ncbi:MAG: DnaJ-like cysteine-rich domain-containing protein [Planctomycetota bacterium]|jgi:hypothetical protein